MSAKYQRTLIKLKEKFGNHCWYCGIELEGISSHIDHVKPKSRGGTNEITNLALSCPFCNYAKKDLTADAFLLWFCHIRSGSYRCDFVKAFPRIAKELNPVERDQLKIEFFRF